MASDYIPKENTGSLFKNENPKSDKSPPFTGNVNVEGVMFRISGFNNESKSGKRYIGITISRVDDQGKSSSFSKSSSSDDGWL